MTPDKPDFETFCAEIIGEPISKAWVTFFAAAEGLPLDDEGVELYRQATGRDKYEPHVYQEMSGIIGRRGEKTQTSLKYLLWLAMYGGYEKQMKSSWFARIARHSRLLRFPIIAQDMRVAGDIQRTVEALTLGSKVLAAEVSEIVKRELIFRNGLCICTFPASKASIRGLACPVALLDELEFVSIEGASPIELIRQVRPAMIQFGASRRLIKLSTPWKRENSVLYDELSHRDTRTDLLIWQASTRTMTPRIAVEDLERERLTDESYYLREYEAEFTDSVESFIPSEDIQVAVQKHTELAPDPTKVYTAAIDASSASGGDRFTLAIATGSEDGVIVSAIRGWKRAPIIQIVDEIAALCSAYNVTRILADQYSHVFVAELLRQRGITLEQLTFTARSKSEIYFALKTSMAQGKMHIPDHAELQRELRALESQRTSAGAYRIGGAHGVHDDFVTTLAILAYQLFQPQAAPPWVEWIPLDPAAQHDTEDDRRRERNAKWQNIMN